MMCVMKVLYKFLNKKDTESAGLSFFKGFLKSDRPFLRDIKRLRVGVNQVNDDFLLIEDHPDVEFITSAGIILHHVREKFLHGQVENVPHFIIDRMGDCELVREIKDILQLIEGALKRPFHDFRVHVCRFFRPSSRTRCAPRP